MRRGLSWAGRRIMNAGMAVPIQQDKAVAAMAAAGCNLVQQQPWQRRASAGFSAKRTGFESFSLRSLFRKSSSSWISKSAVFSKLPFNGSPDFASREFSNGSVMFKFADVAADTLEEKTGIAVDEVSAQSRDTNDEKSQDCTSSSSTAEEASKETEVHKARERVLHLDYAAAMLPHPQKAAKGGEDAYFMEGAWMGVADGVGGWAYEGVDAGLYSRELMRHCKALATKSQGKPEPKDVLIQAASSTKAVGSATVLVAALFDQTLYAANLGDSGFIVVRDWEVVARSNPMQHEFNFPFQVGCEGDHPSKAETFEVSVCKGDIIVLGTDGLFDNLFTDQIVTLLKNTVGSGSGVQAAASKLVSSAQSIGANKDVLSPFGKAAWEERRWAYQGGKLDDVTTVVAFVT